MPIDLTGKSFNIAQNVIDKGQALDLNFSVMNNGDEDVAPFSFDIVISQDNEISEDDFKIGYYDIRTGLEAGQSSGLKSYKYNTPAKNSSFWEGDDNSYTVGIRIDPKSQFFESNEDNNSNVGLGVDFDSVEVKDFDFIFKDQRAELKGSYIDVANETITPGEKVDLSFSVDNESPAIAQPFSVDIYLSPAKGIGVKEAVKLGTFDIRTGIEGNSNSGVKRFSYTTPNLGDAVWGKGDGEYFIALDIDSEDEVAETREGNNRNTGEGLDYTKFGVTGLNSEADLVVKSFSVPENAKAGDTVPVEYEIVNEGETKADLFAAGFYLFDEDYLAENENLDDEDVPEVFFSQGSEVSSLLSLNPGASTGVIADEITLPDSWAGYSGDGDYYLGVEADPFDDVVESSDANNSLTGEMIDYQKITLEAPNDDTVDLAGTSFEVVQSQIVPGQEFDLGFTVKNEGLATADPFSIDFYLSQDANINPEEDKYLGTYDIRDGLGGSEDTDLKSVRYIAPDAEDGFWGEEDGTYYAGMVIDPANDIAESNEENNSNLGMDLDSGSTNVTGLESIADLETKSFAVMAETIETGSQFKVSYEIMNSGTDSAELFGAGFFIFTEDYLMNHDGLDIEDAPQVYFLSGNEADALISLDAGATTGTVTTELAMPEDWAGFASGSGDYYIGFAADPYGDVAESNEMNNSLTGMDMDYQKVAITM